MAAVRDLDIFTLGAALYTPVGEDEVELDDSLERNLAELSVGRDRN